LASIKDSPSIGKEILSDMRESSLFTIVLVLILMEFQAPLLFTSIVLITIAISYLLVKAKKSRKVFL